MTTKTQPPLVDVLASLISRQTPGKTELSGGLILAYTPGSHNQAEPGVYRLTLSRRGKWPSEQEVLIVQRELREALKKHSRHATTINWEPWLRGKPGKRPSDQVLYHVLFWEEMVQASLL
ncbi:MAG: hypothetical protein R3D55_25875 [Chloroflexota bacterium]